MSQSREEERTFLDRLKGRIGSPHDWSNADKVLFVALIVFPIGALFRVCDYYFLTHPEVAPYVNHAHFERFFLLHLFGSEGVWLAIIAAALWLRRRSPHNRLLVHFTVQYYVIGMSLATYFFGTYTSNMAGTVFMGGAAIAFLLFDRGPVLGAMASGLAVLIGTTIGAQTGLIPYAPMMAGR